MTEQSAEQDERPLTVGELRAAMADLPDDAQAFVSGPDGWDRPITWALATQQIAWGDDDHVMGDPTVLGLELSTSRYDEEFDVSIYRADNRPWCRHAPRSEQIAAAQAEVTNAFMDWAAKNEIAAPPLDWSWFGEITRRYSPLHEDHQEADHG